MQTGFLAAEMLMRDVKNDLEPEETGIIISTAHGSLDADLKYSESMKTTPSPSLFVYTLPNILIGAPFIRWRIKGETACFVFDIFDRSFQESYIDILFKTGKIKRCISGWADYYEGKAEANFFLMEKPKD